MPMYVTYPNLIQAGIFIVAIGQREAIRNWPDSVGYMQYATQRNGMFTNLNDKEKRYTITIRRFYLFEFKRVYSDI